MCEPVTMAVVGAALTGAQHIMQRRAADDAADERTRIIRQGLADQDASQRRINDLVVDSLYEYEPAQVTQAYEAEKEHVGDTLQASLAEARAARPDKAATGRLSEAYTEKVARDVADEQADLIGRTKRAAALQAPMNVNRALGYQQNRVGEEVMRQHGIAGGQQGITQLRLSSVREDPSLLGEAAGAVGGSMLTSGLGGIYSNTTTPYAAALSKHSRLNANAIRGV